MWNVVSPERKRSEPFDETIQERYILMLEFDGLTYYN